MRKLRSFGAVGISAFVFSVAAPFGARAQSVEPAPAVTGLDALAGPADRAAPLDLGALHPPPEPAGTANPLQAISLSKLSATRDRPLFSVSRRPPPPLLVSAPPPPPATDKPAAPEAPPFTLVGTIIGEADRIGIFVNDASKVATRIRLGEQASGWTLRSVDPRSAVLEGEGRMVTLDLPKPGANGEVADDATTPPRVSGVLRAHNAPRDNSDGL